MVPDADLGDAFFMGTGCQVPNHSPSAQILQVAQVHHDTVREFQMVDSPLRSLVDGALRTGTIRRQDVDAPDLGLRRRPDRNHRHPYKKDRVQNSHFRTPKARKKKPGVTLNVTAGKIDSFRQIEKTTGTVRV